MEFNILCTVNAANEKHGRDVYRFFRDEMGAKWIQFIPIVERATEETIDIANLGLERAARAQAAALHADPATSSPKRSVGGEQYGRFLVDIFEEWVRHDVGKVFVQMFDVTLEAYFGRHSLCIHAPTCGYGPALEYNGDRLLLRSLRRAALSARQYPRDAPAEARGFGRAAQVRR